MDRRSGMYERLYEDNEKLLWFVARRYGFVCERDPAIAQEDLVNAGFFGLLKAAETYDPEGVSWAKWAIWHVKRAMLQSCGYLREADHLSLDVPVEEDSDLTFLDTIPDNGPPVEEAAEREAVRAEVRAAVDRLKDPRQRDVIRAWKLEGRTLEQIAQDIGCSPSFIQMTARKALRKLAADRRLRDLDDRTRFHAYKSVTAFRNDLTSVTEGAALWRIAQERK